MYTYPTMLGLLSLTRVLRNLTTTNVSEIIVALSKLALATSLTNRSAEVAIFVLMYRLTFSKVFPS